MSGEQTGAWLDEIERLYRRWIAGPGDAAFAISAVPKLVAAVRAALDLHHPEPGPWGNDVCATCIGSGEELLDWPCPTYRAIAAALADTTEVDRG
jgi:hypothetical protein